MCRWKHFPQCLYLASRSVQIFETAAAEANNACKIPAIQPKYGVIVDCTFLKYLCIKFIQWLYVSVMELTRQSGILELLETRRWGCSRQEAIGRSWGQIDYSAFLRTNPDQQRGNWKDPGHSQTLPNCLFNKNTDESLPHLGFTSSPYLLRRNKSLMVLLLHDGELPGSCWILGGVSAPPACYSRFSATIISHFLSSSNTRHLLSSPDNRKH